MSLIASLLLFSLAFLVCASSASPLLDRANKLAEIAIEELLPNELTPSDPDTRRNVSEIIRSRGYLAEDHDVVTKDGYILTVQRIVNPLVDATYRNKLKPVIMQHGLMSSSADFVINSVNVRPEAYPKPSSSISTGGIDEKVPQVDNHLDGPGELVSGPSNSSTSKETRDSQEKPNSLGFYLSNRGYDVWLANSRGNIYGQRHVRMSSWDLRFWDFTFDEQIEFDLPAIIHYVQRTTNKTKLGYVGHSQGTVMGFGLLSEHPEYNEIIEPFVAFAPVAYCNNAVTPVKYFAVYTPLWSHVNLWFATSNVAVKYLAPIVCGPEKVRRGVCANLLFLSVGFDEDELDDSRVAAYLNHVPSGTSIKNVAHYGQEVLSGRFAKFDHGILGNLYKYGTMKSPSYDLAKIRSKSIALFTAENDWLASPKDVKRLMSELTVPLYDHFNVSTVKPKWNHVDFVYAKDAGSIINPRVERIMEAFRDDNNQR